MTSCISIGQYGMTSSVYGSSARNKSELLFVITLHGGTQTKDL